MKHSGMKHRTALLWFIGLLIFTGLACAQSGEILTPEEATRQAAEDNNAGTSNDGESGSEVQSGDFAVGDSAILLGRSFLVNLYDAPGGKISAGQERGATVTVLAVGLDDEGDLWYQIEAPTGQGWVRADALEPIEEEEAADGGEDSADDGDTGSGAGAATDGPQPGDEVYLTARGFLVNLFDGPGSNRIIAGQERGVPVVILAVETVDGVKWYQVDAPTGEGWIPEENITTEAP